MEGGNKGEMWNRRERFEQRKEYILKWISVHLRAKEGIMTRTKYTCINVRYRAEWDKPQDVVKIVKDVRFRRRDSGGRHMKRDLETINPSSFWAVTRARKVLTAVTAQDRQENKSKTRNPTVSSLHVKNENWK